MSLDLVGFAPGDVDAATISLPARNTGSVMLVGVSNALVVLFAKFIFVGIRIGIAATPELFDETLALVVSGKLLEGLPLFVCDDVSDVLIQPVLVSLLEFDLLFPRLTHRVLILLAGLTLLRETGGNREGKR